MKYRGVSWYPEFWPRADWEADVRLMREMSLNIVRLAEFAWADLEPEEGRFETQWLTDVLSLLRDHDIQVLMCTPSCTPPKWVVKAYPETCVITPDGKAVDHYSRKYVCPNSCKVHELVGRVIEQMAEACAPFDNIAGWQIDNEMGPHEVGPCFCDQCESGFRDWLASKYGDLEALNHHWQTGHWSQQITAWDQLDLPRNRTVPAISLDFARFVHDSWTGYFDLQRDALQEAGVTGPISTNFMSPIYEALDYWEFAKHVDTILVDHYLHGMQHGASAFAMDLMRGLKGQRFWIAETNTPGDLAEAHRCQLRLWAYRALARGAEAMIYFRWRPCLSGPEQSGRGLLSHSRIQAPAVEQIKQTYHEMDEVADQLANLPLPRPQVAVVFDWWAMLARGKPGTYMTSPMRAIEEDLNAIYHRLLARGLTCDVVGPGSDLSQYKLVIVPGRAAELSDDRLARSLRELVESGGTVLATARLAAKDQYNCHYTDPRPRGLDEVFGVQVAQDAGYHKGAGVWARPDGMPFPEVEFDGVTQSAGQVAELLQVESADVVGTYTSSFYRGQPAITVHNRGQGHAIYCGLAPQGEILDRLIDRAVKTAGVQTHELPAGVELIDCDRFRFYLNNNDHAIELAEAPEGELLVSDLDGRTLPGYGVVVAKTG